MTSRRRTPATYAVPNVVAVAATDNQDGLASFSNYGPTTVHLGAPGVKGPVDDARWRVDSFSGTSMATPHVRLGCAVAHARRSLDTAALKTLILSSVDPIPSLAGRTDHRWASEPGACGRRLRTCRQRRTQRHTNGAGGGCDDFGAQATDVGRERV